MVLLSNKDHLPIFLAPDNDLRSHFPDLEVKCSDGSVLAHRAVLASQLSLCKMCLSNGQTEDEQMTTMILPHFKKDQVRTFQIIKGKFLMMYYL